MTDTAALARSITKSSSKQSYLTARLLADRDLGDDCMRAYAYFRWADDMIDVSFQSSTDRTVFIARQKQLIDALYRGERPTDITPEEEMLADLVAHDRGPDSGLRSFIHNFMAVIEFDAAAQRAPGFQQGIECLHILAVNRRDGRPAIFHRQRASLSENDGQEPGSDRCSYCAYAARYTGRCPCRVHKYSIGRNPATRHKL